MKVTKLLGFIAKHITGQFPPKDAYVIALKFSELKKEIKKANPDWEIETIDIEDFLMEYEEDINRKARQGTDADCRLELKR